MSDIVIVALVSGAFSFLATIIGILASNKLTTYRIGKLEEKVNKHNSIIERTYKLETEQEVFKEQIKVCNHRIEDLERIK